ncbi:MAG: plastocyanin/azurin family copper-binding protein [Bacteroidota bacterium]|jgi:azurin
MKKIILSSALLYVLASCGGNQPQQNSETATPAAEATPQTIEFTINAVGNTMADMAYDTKEIKAKSGAKVVINLTNQGNDAAMIHNLVIVKQGAEKDVAMEGLNLKDQNYFNATNPNVIAGSSMAEPGKTVTFEFTAPEPGTYTYICTYPGHWMKMQGILIVE